MYSGGYRGWDLFYFLDEIDRPFVWKKSEKVKMELIWLHVLRDLKSSDRVNIISPVKKALDINIQKFI